MYIVRDKSTKNIVHKNPAPLKQNLAPTEVYHAFDTATMEIGKIDGALPDHWTIDSDGTIRELTDGEKVAAGILTPEPNQKIVGDQIVDKTRQDQVDSGEVTLAEIREIEVLRLRGEVETHFRTAKTASGYRLDNLARQKAAVSLQFRALPDTDPQKNQLLADGIIYANAVTDEIQAAAKAVNAGYGQAKAAIDDCLAQAKPVTEFEAVRLESYM